MRLYDRTPETEAQWERADLMFGGLIAVLTVMLALAWVLRAYGIVVVPEPPTVTIWEEVIPSEPRHGTAVAPTITTTSVTGPVVTTTLPPAPTTTLDAEERAFWANRLNKERQREATTTTHTHAPTTTMTPNRPISPSGDADDLCAQINGIPERTTRWCLTVAHWLEHWDALNFQVLRHNLVIIDCESKGDPTAKNPTSTASGLYQHITPFRDPRALKYLGRPVVSWFDGPDNIAVGVGLYVDKGASHWPNCGRR